MAEKKSFVDEFKTFVSRGHVMDLAVWTDHRIGVHGDREILGCRYRHAHYRHGTGRVNFTSSKS